MSLNALRERFDALNAPAAVAFPHWTDKVVRGVILLAILGGPTAPFLVAYGFSPLTMAVGYAPEQPVPYSHEIHVGKLGLDCRYCHTGVETGAKANIPPTQTCMNCHAKVMTNSAKLEPLRESFETGKPVEWIRVHDLPDFVHFDHSAHVVSAGIECQECHGAMEKRTVAERENSLEMGWCLSCHKSHPSVDENYGTDAQLRRAELKDCYTCHK